RLQRWSNDDSDALTAPGWRRRHCVPACADSPVGSGTDDARRLCGAASAILRSTLRRTRFHRLHRHLRFAPERRAEFQSPRARGANHQLPVPAVWKWRVSDQDGHEQLGERSRSGIGWVDRGRRRPCRAIPPRTGHEIAAPRLLAIWLLWRRRLWRATIRGSRYVRRHAELWPRRASRSAQLAGRRCRSALSPAPAQRLRLHIRIVANVGVSTRPNGELRRQPALAP